MGFRNSSAHAVLSAVQEIRVDLAVVPITLDGNWGEMVLESVQRVLELARRCCLQEMTLRSDRQPSSLQIKRHLDGPPAVWLHEKPAEIAIIIVNIGERDWSQLAYQFGHELGHVVANSWKPDSTTSPPSHWLEEALVEALSLYGLEALASAWMKEPPFTDDASFGTEILEYQKKVIKSHQKSRNALTNFDEWAKFFEMHRREFESKPELNEHAKLFSVTLLKYIRQSPRSASALCALNRWSERGAVQLNEYLARWIESCKELDVDTTLPENIKKAVIRH